MKFEYIRVLGIVYEIFVTILRRGFFIEKYKLFMGG